MKPIFLIGHTRSGSTLLMRMLNASPEIRVYGETDGVSFHVYKMYQALVLGGINASNGGITEEDSEKLLSDTSHWQARCSCYQPETFREPLKEIIDRLKAPFGESGRRCGFKEVVAGTETGYVDMLLDFYPDAQIIHSIRHPRTFLISLKRLGWMGDPIGHLNGWLKRCETFIENVHNHPESVRLVTYESMVEAVLRDVWRWLDVPFDAGAERALKTRVYAAGKPEIQLTPEEEGMVDACLARQSLYASSWRLDTRSPEEAQAQARRGAAGVEPSQAHALSGRCDQSPVQEPDRPPDT